MNAHSVVTSQQCCEELVWIFNSVVIDFVFFQVKNLLSFITFSGYSMYSLLAVTDLERLTNPRGDAFPSEHGESHGLHTKTSSNIHRYIGRLVCLFHKFCFNLFCSILQPVMLKRCYEYSLIVLCVNHKLLESY